MRRPAHDTTSACQESFAGLLEALPQQPPGTGHGVDIDAANEVLLDGTASAQQKREALLGWLRRSQPCLFGRLAARAEQGAAVSKGLSFELCWIDDGDLDHGPAHITAKVQAARRAWKQRAATGESSAFLIVFNSARIAHAVPGPELADLCLALADTYLVEHAPVAYDTVYTEAVPLQLRDGSSVLFKASTQLFYTGAHLHRNHDRRIPGGLVISVNAPGHYAHSLVERGLVPDLDAAIAFVRDNALLTIGNGGIGHPDRLSSSWHNPLPADATCPREADSIRETTVAREAAVARQAAVDPDTFSAVYQIDVLVQKELVTDPGERHGEHLAEEVWPSLRLDYITTDEFPVDDPDFGWSNGRPVDDGARFDNPWEPVVAANTPDFNY
ncbi:hypothetical protein [Kitasatospora sp. McL0602]|uniref:hypothetical protein n=1 Tax=Kitasatospora sp. McL0602 TaxID=3439530 RepID=UPI003F88A14B